MFPSFTRDIQRALLWILGILLFGLSLRDYHPLWYNIPVDFWLTDEEVTKSNNTTHPLHFWRGFGLLCAAFDRLY